MAVRGGGRCLGGGARLQEVEQGWGPGDRSPGGGTGAGAELRLRGAAYRDPRGQRRAPPSPSPRRLAASPRGGAGNRSHSASPKFDSPPREESQGGCLSGHRAPPPPRPGPASPSLGVGASSRETLRACARAAALALLPAVLQAPRPPSSRVTGVDGRPGARAGPWRSR